VIELRKIFFSSTALRIINLLATAFILCLIMHLSKGQKQFVSFLKSWKITSIVSLLVFIFHLALELKIAIEDYVPKAGQRIVIIKILWGITIVTIALLGITIGRL